jgi:hypothetical protein
MRTQGYRNTVLTAIAVLLALNLLAGLDAGPSETLAQTRAVSGPGRAAEAAPPIDDESTPSARISAAEQRRTMIQELRGMSQRLDRIEAAMRAGLNVRVTEMPELRLPPAARDAK